MVTNASRTPRAAPRLSDSGAPRHGPAADVDDAVEVEQERVVRLDQRRLCIRTPRSPGLGCPSCQLPAHPRLAPQRGADLPQRGGVVPQVRAHGGRRAPAAPGRPPCRRCASATGPGRTRRSPRPGWPHDPAEALGGLRVPARAELGAGQGLADAPRLRLGRRRRARAAAAAAAGLPPPGAPPRAGTSRRRRRSARRVRAPGNQRGVRSLHHYVGPPSNGKSSRVSGQSGTTSSSGHNHGSIRQTGECARHAEHRGAVAGRPAAATVPRRPLRGRRPRGRHLPAVRPDRRGRLCGTFSADDPNNVVAPDPSRRGPARTARPARRSGAGWPTGVLTVDAAPALYVYEEGGDGHPAAGPDRRRGPGDPGQRSRPAARETSARGPVADRLGADAGHRGEPRADLPAVRGRRRRPPGSSTTWPSPRLPLLDVAHRATGSGTGCGRSPTPPSIDAVARRPARPAGAHRRRPPPLRDLPALQRERREAGAGTARGTTGSPCSSTPPPTRRR